MKMLRIGLAVLLLLGVTAVRAYDEKDLDKDKLVGTWEVTKGETLELGSTCEFTKDGKLTFVIKEKGQTNKLEGTYKIDGQAFKATLKFGDKEATQTLKVPTLTDTELVMVDENGKKEYKNTGATKGCKRIDLPSLSMVPAPKKSSARRLYSSGLS